MQRKPSFQSQYPELTFPIYELTRDSWHGPCSLSSRDPTGSSFVDAVGPLHSVRLAFGVIGRHEPWWTVTSTAPGAFDRRTSLPHEQIYTHDGPPADRAARELKLATVLVSNMRELLGTVSSEVDPWGVADDAKPLPIAIAIDDHVEHFQVVRSGDLIAASANLQTGTVTIVGSGDPDDLALQTVVDPAPYT